MYRVMTRARRPSTRLSDLQSFVSANHDGRCLSENYLGSTENHWFSCNADHVFSATPANVIHHQSWCPYCAGNARLAIETFQQYAKYHKGKCLSKIYVNSTTKLDFQCKNKHTFSFIPKSLHNRRSWCSICDRLAAQRKEYLRIRRLCNKSGIQLLSEVYINSNTELNFQCKKGHEFTFKSKHLPDRPVWCPDCHKLAVKRYYYERIKHALQKKGFELRSTQYVNSETKMCAVCRKGHELWCLPSSFLKPTSSCLHCVRIERRLRAKIKAKSKRRETAG